MQASLGLPIVDAEGREHTLVGTMLRGSPSRPGTVESLGPGESLTIRFPGWIGIMDSPTAPVTGDAQLFARLILRQRVSRLERGDVPARERSVSWEKLARSRTRDAGKFDVLRVAPFRITAYRYQQSLSNFLRLLTCKGLRPSSVQYQPGSSPSKNDSRLTAGATDLSPCTEMSEVRTRSRQSCASPVN